MKAPWARLPIAYLHQGRQFIVLSVGDGTNPAQIVALALPRERE